MIIYLDTETTGLRPGNICQLSYVMQTKESIKAKNFFFTVDFVEMGAYSVHGFSVEKLKQLSGGKRFSDCIDEIENDFNSANLIISHNTAFDFMFLRSEFINSNRTFLVNNEFCSMKKSTPLLKLRRTDRVSYKYPKLNELCEFFEITDSQIGEASKKFFGEKAGFHDARFDTTAVVLCINKSIGNFDDLFDLYKYL